MESILEYIGTGGIANDSKEIAEAQWTCIAALKEKYKGRRVKGSRNYFEDDEWRAEDENIAIIWTSLDPLCNRPALVLFLRIAIYCYIEARGGTIRSHVNSVSTFMQFFNDVINSKGILIGVEGSPLVGFDAIGSDDLVAAFDKRITLGKKIDHGKTFLAIVKELPRHCINGLSLFSVNFDYPWHETTFDLWQTKRFADLGLSIPDTKSYLAMPPEVTQPLIERSMFLIETLSDEITGFHHDARSLDLCSYVPFVKSEAGARFIAERLPFLEGINKLGFLQKQGLKNCARRLAKITDILKVACINIILLTTGLRNVDLTLLKVGCCKPSGRGDLLFYIDAEIKKTGIHMRLPVPEQTMKAVAILERLRWNDSNPYLIAPTRLGRRNSEGKLSHITTDTLNDWLSMFAKWFDIPFFPSERTDQEFTAHCYRATVAGWLDAASNLSILLVRRLFGHANQLMPLAYLQHNPIFIKARKEAIEIAANTMAKRMSDAAATGRLSGMRGEELLEGYKIHRGVSTAFSESLTDHELQVTFQERIKERILSGSMLAMLTPFGVICTRNPNDSSQPPCAKLSDREKLREYGIDREIWNFVRSAPNPGQCVGKRCSHAMLGPWSTAIKESFLWYIDFLEGRSGQTLSTETMRLEAQSFVKQYAPDIQKVFSGDP